MNLRKIRTILLLSISTTALTAQELAKDVFALQRKHWLHIAETSKPELIETIKKPVSIVKITADKTAFQGWKVQGDQPLTALYQSSFKKQTGVIIDFKEHLTGYFIFSLKAIKGTPDAPLRFKFTFGEVPSEMVTPFDPYQGALSRAWLQDEIITVMDLPARIAIPRRFAFRYLKMELLGSSPYFDFAFSDMEVKATSSVNVQPLPLRKGTSALIAAIDSVGQNTLKECMQTVYEDGPKRDRRLWIGDLYLEALANSQSFKKHELTKRCLYLLAGLSREDGFLHSSVFEQPEPHPQAGVSFLFDYSLLYNVALLEYLAATGDKATAIDLWPVAKKQLENPLRFLKTNGMFDAQQATKNNWWLFVDWNTALDREASILGIIIYSLKKSCQLAERLGKADEVKHLPGLIQQLTAGARNQLYNKKTGLFESGPERQLSYASQAWMILSGVASKSEGRRAMKAVAMEKDAMMPKTPYLYHYVVEAMIQTGMTLEAKTLVEKYWGGMIRKGADTFWEAYDPDNDYLSPYNFFPINSYCHAWSCTPVYFIRKYPDIFQNR